MKPEHWTHGQESRQPLRIAIERQDCCEARVVAYGTYAGCPVRH